MVFTVDPVSDLQTGAEIRARARIVFDTNEPIDTSEWVNTIDKDPPSSRVVLAPTQGTPHFTVEWTGADAQAGVASYSVYVSENAGAPVLWKHRTQGGSARFAGKPGATYAFYTLATDRADNEEVGPSSAVATTVVTTPLGDVSLDEVVGILDVLLTVKSVVQLETLTGAQRAVADMNGDNRISVLDAVAILRKIVGLP